MVDDSAESASDLVTSECEPAERARAGRGRWGAREPAHCAPASRAAVNGATSNSTAVCDNIVR